MNKVDKILTTMYPKKGNISNFKIFQNPTSQIKAFRFTREHIRDVEMTNSGLNYAVYFLIGEQNTSGKVEIYIGKSTNGAKRIKDHNSNKSFWTSCIMFVTDNNSFDTSTIDYLEYYFIQKFKGTNKYLLDNKDLRVKEPNLTEYIKSAAIAYIKEVEFLLKTEGIELTQKIDGRLMEELNAEEELYRKENSNSQEDPIVGVELNMKKESRQIGVATNEIRKMYYPKKGDYDAGVFVENGEYIIPKGSIIKGLDPKTKAWKNGHYERSKRDVRTLLEEKRIELYGDKYKTLVDLHFGSPSAAAAIISGGGTSGWVFFIGIDELRKKGKWH